MKSFVHQKWFHWSRLKVKKQIVQLMAFPFLYAIMQLYHFVHPLLTTCVIFAMIIIFEMRRKKASCLLAIEFEGLVYVSPPPSLFLNIKQIKNKTMLQKPTHCFYGCDFTEWETNWLSMTIYLFFNIYVFITTLPSGLQIPR